MTDRAECRGAGEGMASRRNGGGRHDRRGRCSACGKDLKLTSSGRIPRHVPAPTIDAAVDPFTAEILAAMAEPVDDTGPPSAYWM